MGFQFAVLNGSNLNWLGKRERAIYGLESWGAIWNRLQKWAPSQDANLTYFQSNSEGTLIDTLQEIDSNVDGVVFNPGAYAHTSIALRDCVASLRVPVVEVHLSKLSKREKFRQFSFIADVAQITIVGFGADGYLLGLTWLKYFYDRSEQR